MQCLWASSPLEEKQGKQEHIEHTEEQQEQQEQVHWIVQFYVDKSAARQQEILFCLQQNVRNKYITHVHLLNERHYTDDELGTCSKEANVKIVQTVLGKRATYRDVFAYVRRAGLQGYVCFANSDMVLEEADVPRLFRSSLSTQRQCMALLRYECDLLQLKLETADRDQTIGNVRLFGPRYDSQDVWILHASQLFSPTADRAFSFSFGVPGCDNKVVYVLQALLGYEVINDPLAVRTYHVHASQVRHYTAKDALPRPFGALVPFGLSSQCRDSLGMTSQHAWFTQHPLVLQARLRLSLEKTKTTEEETHVATTVLSGLATTMAVYMRIASTTTDHGLRHSLLSFVQQYQAHMAAREGVVVRTTRAVKAYSDAVLASWQAMTAVFSEDGNGALYQSNQLAYDWLHQSGTCPQDKVHWPGLLESWHLSSFPKREEQWIQSIVGQRRLAVVSSVKETLLQGQFAKRTSFTYNQVDLFPGSTLVACVVGPDSEEEEGELTTEGDTQVKKEDEKKQDKKKDKKEKKKKADADRNFDTWWPRYCERTLLPLCRREDVDVVLVSCRGYGPLVVHYVAQHGKTALDFGPYLGNWFGCFTASDLRARPDAFRLVLNVDWVKCIE